jgi:hypothetical protein
VTIAGTLTPRQYDSLTAAARKTKPDSARPDSTPTARAPAAPTPRQVDTARARVDSAAARPDTSELHRLLAQRPVPFDKAVLRFAAPLKPETRYVIRVRAAINLNGAVGGDGQIVVLIPKPPEPQKADTANRAPRATPPKPPE